jgi:hypothetical protein
LVFLTAAVTPVAAESPPTDVVVYSPFRVGKGLVEKVVRQSPGICRQGSVADARAGAWLCSNVTGCQGGYVHGHCPAIFVYDPCFSGSRTAAYVVCPLSSVGPGEVPVGAPFGAYVVRLNLIKPLPVTSGHAGGPDTSDGPIAIRLANGATCTLERVPPTAPGVNPVSAYLCAKGYALESSLDRTGPTWVIVYDSRDYFESGPNQTTSVGITTAYW